MRFFTGVTGLTFETPCKKNPEIRAVFKFVKQLWLIDVIRRCEKLFTIFECRVGWKYEGKKKEAGTDIRTLISGDHYLWINWQQRNNLIVIVNQGFFCAWRTLITLFTFLENWVFAFLGFFSKIWLTGFSKIQIWVFPFCTKKSPAIHATHKKVLVRSERCLGTAPFCQLIQPFLMCKNWLFLA